jgi:hypothetical protein
MRVFTATPTSKESDDRIQIAIKLRAANECQTGAMGYFVYCRNEGTFVGAAGG